MSKKGEIFWEVGRQLSEEAWKKNWKRNECVGSQEFTMPDVCTLQIFFYPAGIGDSDRPCFKLVRTNTTLRRIRIKGTVQLCHGDIYPAHFHLDRYFERGESELVHEFKDYPNLRQLQIFHSLPELGYRWMYKVFDPDPNENESEPEPDPDIISSF